MDALLLPSGNLLIPESSELEDGSFSLANVEVAPDDPRYIEWMSYYEKQGKSPPKSLPNRVLDVSRQAEVVEDDPDEIEDPEQQFAAEQQQGEKSAATGRLGSPKPKKIKPSPFLDRDGVIH